MLGDQANCNSDGSGRTHPNPIDPALEELADRLHHMHASQCMSREQAHNVDAPSPTGHLLSPKLSEKARRGLLLLLLLLGLVVLLGVGPSLLL